VGVGSLSSPLGARGPKRGNRNDMELYYKDLISEDASLDKLVDDLMLLVQGADEFAQAAGAGLPVGRKEEIAAHLQQLKTGCRRLKTHAMATGVAVDKLLRQYPYSAIGFAFALGLFVGNRARRKARS
jgi:ElaB/YqjD/DUF883 family membrane-anchored ribosome-binding protein